MKIDPDFKPTEKTYSNLRKHGALPPFVDYELPNMVTYFVERGVSKKSWQMTCQVWMRRAWKGKAGREWEETMRYAKVPFEIWSLAQEVVKKPDFQSEGDDDLLSRRNLDKPLSKEERCAILDKFMGQIE